MISVCIAAYNGARYIREQIESIVPQLGENDEIIVCDDHSTDNTVDIVKHLPYPQIRLYENAENLGYTGNFEHCLSLCRGEYIFLCDQDDVWFPNKVSVCLEALKQADFVVSDAIITDAAGHEIYPSFYAQRGIHRSWFGNIVKFGFLGCLCAFKRSVRDKALPFPKQRHLCTHDNWLFLVGKTFFKVKILTQPLVRYRRHGDNASKGSVYAGTPLTFKIRYRLYLICQLLRRSL